MERLRLFEFQRNCVNELLEAILNGDSKEILLQAPTGSGKTIILLDMISEYNEMLNDVVFVWLTPGNAELEEQSKQKMNKFFPSESSKFLNDVISDGFEGKDTVFINWELVNKTGNTALREFERKNLFDCIDSAYNNGLNFIVLIDEEHLNQTVKSEAVIEYFDPINIIRVSATTKKRNDTKFIQIPEIDVINSGLITKAIYINDMLDTNKVLEDETEYLIDCGLNKREQIRTEYINSNIQINPLLIIQFPNMSDELIEKVEKYLKKKDISYENGRLSIKMDKREKNFDNISDNEANQSVLLMKEAVATGWDCPRAKVLVKLRENMSEDFETQIIGRIRRMPQQMHYNNELLDNCYLYTFDEKYEATIKQELGKNAKDVKLVRLSSKYKDFSLIKEMKSNEDTTIGEREILNIIFEFYKSKYNLSSNKQSNKTILLSKEYVFGISVISNVISDTVVTIDNNEISNAKRYNIETEISIKKHNSDLRRIISSYATEIGIDYDKMRTVLERMFLKRKLFKKRFFDMDLNEFYAFIINNERLIRQDILEAVSQKAIQLSIDYDKIIFKIPEIGIIKYDKSDKDMPYLTKNVYRNYFLSRYKSNSEAMFELFCQTSSKVKWFFKNGESSKNYFSIVYNNMVEKQWLFYPDYIVCDSDNNTWIIETKGGEDKEGNSKNIDKQIENKFEALKRYSSEHNIKWAFVRDNEKNKKLYYCNTEYTDDMRTENWIKISKLF